MPPVNKNAIFVMYIAALVLGLIGGGMLFHLAGWKWSLCSGCLMGAFYFRIGVFILWVKGLPQQYDAVVIPVEEHNAP